MVQNPGRPGAPVVSIDPGSGASVSVGFPPVVDPGCRVLILGSLPGRRSLAEQRYYALPRNAFWPIMGRLFDAGPERPYRQRLDRLLAHRVALWDVLEASVRPGSLDSNIVESTVRCNDFEGFFRAFPAIERVFFNGRKAEQVFMRRVLPALSGGRTIRYQTLPSTSPAHAAMSFEEKLSRWTVVKLG